MTAGYYRAETENGDETDDPSEDGLYMLLSDLDDADNTFLVVEPADPASSWYATVATRDGGGYEVVLRDPAHREHQVWTGDEIGRIAYELTVWLAGRTRPAREDGGRG